MKMESDSNIFSSILLLLLFAFHPLPDEDSLFFLSLLPICVSFIDISKGKRNKSIRFSFLLFLLRPVRIFIISVRPSSAWRDFQCKTSFRMRKQSYRRHKQTGNAVTPSFSFLTIPFEWNRCTKKNGAQFESSFLFLSLSLSLFSPPLLSFLSGLFVSLIPFFSILGNGTRRG